MAQYWCIEFIHSDMNQCWSLKVYNVCGYIISLSENCYSGLSPPSVSKWYTSHWNVVGKAVFVSANETSHHVKSQHHSPDIQSCYHY